MTKLQHVSDMIHHYGLLCKAEQRASADGQEHIAAIYKEAQSALCRYLERLSSAALNADAKGV